MNACSQLEEEIQKQNVLLGQIEEAIQVLSTFLAEDAEEKRLVAELGREIDAFKSVQHIHPKAECQVTEKKEHTLEQISVSEFARLPSYMKGRHSRETFNLILEDLSLVFEKKYKAIAACKKNTAPGMKRKAAAYLQHSELVAKGLRYISEADIREAHPGLKINSVFQNTLSILRHLGRTKEIRKKGLFLIVLQ